MLAVGLDDGWVITKPWSSSIIHPILSTRPYNDHTNNDLSILLSSITRCVGKHSFGVPAVLPPSFQAFLVNAPKAPKVGAPPQYSPSAPAGSNASTNNASANTPPNNSSISTPPSMGGMDMVTPGSASSFQSSSSFGGSTPGSAISVMPS